MSSVCKYLLVALAACSSAHAADPQPLRVCSDPNNLPFSDKAGGGFENALAQLLGKELHQTVEYTWFPQRRGFIRNTLKAKKCDVVLGVPAGYEMVATTKPYYRSSYVFVTRDLDIKSFDDPRLAKLRIGIHAIGDDYAMLPPGKELIAHGLVDHVVGYSIYGDYSKEHPTSTLIDAVASGDIDVAIAWGPLAGYFAKQAKLRVVPIQSDVRGMQFSIAMGVRKDDAKLRERLDKILEEQRPAITKLLTSFGVPLLEVSR